MRILVTSPILCLVTDFERLTETDKCWVKEMDFVLVISLESFDGVKEKRENRKVLKQ